MTRTMKRPRLVGRPSSDWRSRPGMLASGPVVEVAERQAVGIVLTIGATVSQRILAVLRQLSIITVSRRFDDDAVPLVTAMAPDIVVLVCDPALQFDSEIVRLLSKQGVEALLVLDEGGTVAGTVAGLGNGADAVLSGREAVIVMRATVTALLRRNDRSARAAVGASPTAKRAIGELTVDDDRIEIRDGDYVLPLTPTEFKVLSHLAEHAGFDRSASQIMSVLHNYSFSEEEARKTIRVYIRRIKAKLTDGRSASVEIVNFRMLGYRLQAGVDVEPNGGTATVREVNYDPVTEGRSE